MKWNANKQREETSNEYELIETNIGWDRFGIDRIILDEKAGLTRYTDSELYTSERTNIVNSDDTWVEYKWGLISIIRINASVPMPVQRKAMLRTALTTSQRCAQIGIDRSEDLSSRFWVNL